MRFLTPIALVLAVSLASGSARAHEPEPAPSPNPSIPPARSDSSMVTSPTRTSRGPYRMPPLGRALMDHPHNKLIHFPIVLTLVAAAMVILARRRPDLEPFAFWLVWLAALSVLAAFFSGEAQSKQFHGRPKEWLVEFHEKQGIVIGVLEALWLLSLLRTSTRRWSWMIGVALSVLVITAGFIGGLVAHGH